MYDEDAYCDTCGRACECERVDDYTRSGGGARALRVPVSKWVRDGVEQDGVMIVSLSVRAQTTQSIFDTSGPVPRMLPIPETDVVGMIGELIFIDGDGDEQYHILDGKDIITIDDVQAWPR